MASTGKFLPKQRLELAGRRRAKFLVTRRSDASGMETIHSVASSLSLQLERGR